MSESTARILVGRIVKPHGLSGEVVVEVHTDRLERFDPGARLHSKDRTFVVVANRPHQGRLLVRFEGVADRTVAERLRGIRLEADRPEPADAETYDYDELVGMQVLADDGRELGTVRDVVQLPAAAAYDLLEVERADGSRWLLPAAADYVEAREDDQGRGVLVVVDPPEGLVEGRPEEG